MLGLFFLLFIKGLLIANQAHQARNRFAYYLAGGLSLMIAFQALINFAVATGMVPTKGLPLPFISYGGSSLLVNMMAIGFLMNLSRNREEVSIAETDREILRRRRARRELYGMQHGGLR